MSINCLSQVQTKNLFINSLENIVRLNFDDPQNPVPIQTNVASGGTIAEGIAHIEDKNGNIILWVIAKGVYDRDFQRMPGSEGILADPSSTEIVVCKVPGDSLKYYVVYNDQGCTPLYYSIVDISLRNGLGDVVEKNISIDAGNYAEGLEIIKIPCSKDYWLITYQCALGIKRFRITNKGIENGEIIYPYDSQTSGGRGELDYHKGKLGYAVTFGNKALIMNFEATGGTASKGIEILFPTLNGAYGLEFSPDTSKVFITDISNRDFFGDIDGPNLVSCNLKTGQLKTWNIPYNTSNCSGSTVEGLGQIEFGKDQRLYIPHNGGCQISVIEEPDNENTPLGIIDVNSILSLGISDHIQSDFLGDQEFKEPTLYTENDQDYFCKGTEITLWTDTIEKYQYSWFFNNTLIEEVSTPGISANIEGDYHVQILDENNCIIYSRTAKILERIVPTPHLGPDTIVCGNESFKLDTQLEDFDFEWSDGSSSSYLEAASSGKYWVRVSQGICLQTDTIDVQFKEGEDIFVPSIFTPNVDPWNENFEILTDNEPVSVIIVNRWGGVVFQSIDYRNDWNGKNLPVGVYFYKVIVGNSCKNEVNGFVYLFK